MQHVLDLMVANPPSVSPNMPVHDLLALLVNGGRDGYCVVENGALLGVVTSMDVLFQEKKIRLPTFFTFMESVVEFGAKRTRAEIAKMTGVVVRDIMSASPVTVAYDAALDEVATLMVEKHISLLPVLKDGVLVGEITKASVLAALYTAFERDHAGAR